MAISSIDQLLRSVYEWNRQQAGDKIAVSVGKVTSIVSHIAVDFVPMEM